VYLTARERDLLLEAARRSAPRGVHSGTHRDTAVIALGVYAGLRVSELRGLDLADVDLVTGTVRVRHGKGDKDRELPLHRVACAAVAAYALDREDDEPALFLSRHGRRISVRALQDVVYRLATDAALTKHISPHKLRHTFATSFLEANPGAIRVLKELMGHASIETTDLYTHVTHERERRDIDRL
jgi:site-specific recombinase XerC